MKSDYANRDSLKWIVKEIKKDARVSDIAYMEDLVDQVNYNLSRISIILFVLAILLTFVSFSLISNTVRLSVYARRFIIHTMKLVGASWSFIRRPFLRSAVCVGVIAAILSARHFVNSRMGGTHHYRLCCAPVWCAHHIPVCMACSQ